MLYLETYDELIDSIEATIDAPQWCDTFLAWPEGDYYEDYWVTAAKEIAARAYKFGKEEGRHEC